MSDNIFSLIFLKEGFILSFKAFIIIQNYDRVLCGQAEYLPGSIFLVVSGYNGMWPKRLFSKEDCWQFQGCLALQRCGMLHYISFQSIS